MTVTSTSTLRSDPSNVHWNRRDRLQIALLVFCTFALYFRTRHFDFIAYDDQLYVYQNAHVLQGLSLQNLRWASTMLMVGNWHPLTIVAELVISSLFGPTAGAFHLSSAVLHTVNVVLLYTFLRKCTGRAWAAFFTAGLWGLHPLRVESVAWVSELKDVLCGTLWLACMLAYLRYSYHRTIGRFGLVVLLHALALTAKPMAATLPAVLLLLDYWSITQIGAVASKMKWWTARILEKLPLLALSTADMAYAAYTQRDYMSPQSTALPTSLRFENALLSYVAYLRDMFFPRNLAVFYPHPAMVNATIPLISVIISGAILLAITAVACVRLKSRPYLAVGWFWFLGTLVPVIGIVQLGEQARADRYTYLPSVGITMAVVWSISDLTATRYVWRVATGIAGALSMTVLAISTSFTVGHWKNTRTLFDYVREVQPDNFLALTIYSGELRQAGSIEQSLEVARRAVAIAPGSGPAHANLGSALQAAGRLPQAEEQFTEALSLGPPLPDYWIGKGNIRHFQANQAAAHGDPAEKKFRQTAIEDFQRSIDLNPDSIDAREHLAVELAILGRLDEAISVWQELLGLMPNDAQAQGDLADALRLKKDLSGAVEHYQAAIAAGSRNPAWETELAYLVASNPQAEPRDVQPMVAIAKDACEQTHYHDAAALDAYAACLYRVGRIDDAITAARQGVAQANAAHEPAIAAEIQKRLALYQSGLP